MKDSYEKAISAYQKVLKTDPGHRKTYKDLGIAYFGRGDIEKALACLKKALDLGLMSVDIYYHLGLIYKIMGFGDTAIFNFKKALKGNSSLFQLALIYSKLGRLYFEKGFLDEAFHTLKKSYQINPRDLDTCLNLAFVYDEKELLEDAISMYNQAFCLNTSLAVSAEIQARLGLIYLSFGLVEESLFLSKNAILTHSDGGLAHAILGCVYLMRGSYSKAIEHYEKRCKEFPDDMLSLYNLGVAYQRDAQVNKAISSCHSKLSQEPGNPITFFLLGKNHLSLENHDKAIMALEKAIALNPKDVQCQYYLARAFKEAGKADTAKVHYHRYLSLKSEPDAKDYFRLGCMHSRRGSIDDAIQAFKQSIELNSQNIALAPTNIRSYAILGRAYAEKGMRDESIKTYKRALVFDSEDADIYLALGAMFLAKDLYREAMDAYSKANRLIISKNRFSLTQSYLSEGEDKVINPGHGKSVDFLQDSKIANERVEGHERKELTEESPGYSEKENKIGKPYCKKQMKETLSNLSERQVDKIIADNKVLIKREPQNLEAYNAVGEAYGRKELHDEAIYYYKRAVKLDPGDANAYARLGLAYYVSGVASAAIACYEKAFNLNPDNSEICVTLAECFFAENNFDKAIEYCRKITDRKLEIPVSIRLHTCLAEVYRIKAQYENSIDSYEWLLKEAKIVTDAIYRNLAECYRGIKDYAKMAEYVREALTLNPGDAEIRRWLADFYYQNGKINESMGHYQNLADSDSVDADVLARLAWLHLLKTEKS